jgi:transposase
VSWLGLAPKVEKSANTVKIGSITKMGNEYLRRLLVHGARSLLHWSRLGKAGGRRPWLEDMLKRRPKPVVIVALAAKLARIAWAILVRGGRYRPPLAATARPRGAAA